MASPLQPQLSTSSPSGSPPRRLARPSPPAGGQPGPSCLPVLPQHPAACLLPTSSTLQPILASPPVQRTQNNASDRRKASPSHATRPRHCPTHHQAPPCCQPTPQSHTTPKHSKSPPNTAQPPQNHAPTPTRVPPPSPLHATRPHGTMPAPDSPTSPDKAPDHDMPAKMLAKGHQTRQASPPGPPQAHGATRLRLRPRAARGDRRPPQTQLSSSDRAAADKMTATNLVDRHQTRPPSPPGAPEAQGATRLRLRPRGGPRRPAAHPDPTWRLTGQHDHSQLLGCEPRNSAGQPLESPPVPRRRSMASGDPRRPVAGPFTRGQHPLTHPDTTTRAERPPTHSPPQQHSPRDLPRAPALLRRLRWRQRRPPQHLRSTWPWMFCMVKALAAVKPERFPGIGPAESDNPGNGSVYTCISRHEFGILPK